MTLTELLAPIKERLSEMTPENIEKGFAHPCRKTCSGWYGGRQWGLLECQTDITRLVKALEIADEAIKFYGNSDNYEVLKSGQCTMFADAENYPEDAKFGVKARNARNEILKALAAE